MERSALEMIILLCGPTGAGKTSLATVLSDQGYSVVRETIPADVFQQFRSEPRLHCAELQRSIIQARISAFKAIPSSEKVVFDRSVDEDTRIFCRMHFERGLLSHDEFHELIALAETAQQVLPTPDLTIFLNGPHDGLLARLRADSHPDAIIDSLPRQLELYAEWIAGQPDPILQLDNTRCTLETFGKFMKGL